MGPWAPPNPIGVFWGHKSTANGSSCSAEHNPIGGGISNPKNTPIVFGGT
ncbi:Hypothetical protein FKW44_001612 [Caligus rogercresseyi]|uniref:Uncharacterized protein n=1 Tax=Caligus rogercresseyi TaxID=217165 RepID=A0A7T8KIZ5_CALRO|nr:Hypothetical protein FKW44_001612 [Caligus rogercresseyi]